MSEYKMPVIKGDKMIYFILCSFCKNVQLPGGFECSLKMTPNDPCLFFEQVDSVKERVDEIFERLPDRAGSDMITGDKDGSCGQDEAADAALDPDDRENWGAKNEWNLKTPYTLLTGRSPCGTVCGQVFDASGNLLWSFRDLSELLILLKTGNGMEPEENEEIYISSTGQWLRCTVILMFRQNDTVQGVFGVNDAEVPFRSGMELMYLIREAVERKR